MLKIVGDINLTDGYFDIGFGIGTKIALGLDPFKNIKRSDTDKWIGNFEGVASDISVKEGIAAKQFRISPSLLTNIQHLDFYNVANNHTMQHGENAFQQTLSSITSFGSVYFGSDNKRSIIFEHQGKKIGLMSFSQRRENFTQNPMYWYCPEYKDIEFEFCNLINCDYKIVYIHWGNEFINKPYSDQIYFAHWLIDIGFDIIVGMHPHLLQGYEIYKGKYIFYSLGNFVFNMSWEPLKYSVLLNIDLSKNVPKIDYNYVYTGLHGVPKIIDVSNVPYNYRFEYLNLEIYKITNNEEYYIKLMDCINKYRKINKLNILNNVYKFGFVNFFRLMMEYIKRRINKF